MNWHSFDQNFKNQPRKEATQIELCIILETLEIKSPSVTAFFIILTCLYVWLRTKSWIIILFCLVKVPILPLNKLQVAAFIWNSAEHPKLSGSCFYMLTNCVCFYRHSNSLLQLINLNNLYSNYLIWTCVRK